MLLTHLHGDHVAGLLDLPPEVPVIASGAAIAHLRGLGDCAAIRAACPPLLRDGVLARNPQPVEARPLTVTGLEEYPMGHDLPGDAPAYRRSFAALRRLMERRPNISFVPSHSPEIAVGGTS